MEVFLFGLMNVWIGLVDGIIDGIKAFFVRVLKILLGILVFRDAF
jgi:hypothetical protein